MEAEEVGSLLLDPEIAALLEKRRVELLTGGDPAFAKAPPAVAPRELDAAASWRISGTEDAQSPPSGQCSQGILPVSAAAHSQVTQETGSSAAAATAGLTEPAAHAMSASSVALIPPAAALTASSSSGSGSGMAACARAAAAEAGRGPPGTLATGAKGGYSAPSMGKDPVESGKRCGSYGPAAGSTVKAAASRPSPYGGHVQNSGLAMGDGSFDSVQAAQCKGVALIPKAAGPCGGYFAAGKGGAWPAGGGWAIYPTRPNYLEAKKQFELQKQQQALAMKRGGPNMLSTSAVVMDEEQAKRFQEALKRRTT